MSGVFGHEWKEFSAPATMEVTAVTFRRRNCRAPLSDRLNVYVCCPPESVSGMAAQFPGGMPAAKGGFSKPVL